MRYEHVSGLLFALISVAQLTRAVLAVPAQIGTVPIPIWVSVVAFFVTGSLSVWAFRSAKRPS